MDGTKSILKDIRLAVGLSSDTTDFDTELLMHINGALGKLNQNGIGKFLIIKDDTSIWDDFIDPIQEDGNQYKGLIPLYVELSTKLLFDPPPPSNAQYHVTNAEQLLWRLKIAYEQPYVAPVVTQDE